MKRAAPVRRNPFYLNLPQGVREAQERAWNGIPDPGLDEFFAEEERQKTFFKRQRQNRNGNGIFRPKGR